MALATSTSFQPLLDLPDNTKFGVDGLTSTQSLLDGYIFEKVDTPEREKAKPRLASEREMQDLAMNTNMTAGPALSEVRHIAEKGYGTFALVDIPRGTRIMSEAPLIVMENPRWLTADLEKEFSKLSPDDQAAYMSLHSAHGQNPQYWDPVKRNAPLSANAMERVEEQYAARIAPEKSLVSIFQTNCMGIDERGAGVFLKCARINHSCMPNAFFSYNARTGKENIHSIKTIKAGDEITICYCDPFNDTAKRAWHMRHYGFTCVCEACWENQPFGSKTDLSFQRRYRLREISDQTADDINKLFPSTDHLMRLVNALSEAAMLLIQEDLKVAELGRM
ncbi:SET domain-containing protein [Pseudovirgaria hyperparasitica]|uniref:SET domain-containing protein n=1 Tax=Pseudovirgaria hyperparasitica TaxID=470096 RepID=A0A6A6WAA9_9PEZI|nr:SET domain-containing protein [Pseudovirgaria hyperparasitica]KAF2758890.1 SET domain-containing protein [Pseudovirgaria hyperparasitica]